jgi:hypothetical protein
MMPKLINYPRLELKFGAEEKIQRSIDQIVLASFAF